MTRGKCARLAHVASRVLLATTFTITAACGGGTSATPGPFAHKAEQLVDDLATGNFAAVTADFDPTMRAGLPLAVMQNDWRTIQEHYGAYKSRGTPVSVMKGQLDVERVPVTMGSNQMEVRVTFHPDGTIAGLYFFNASAPPP